MKSKKRIQLQSSATDQAPTSYSFYTAIHVPICKYKAVLNSMAVRLHKAVLRLFDCAKLCSNQK